MKIIGLTGGISSGKNFVAEIFAKNGAAVFDADAEVHKLLESDKSVIEQISIFFPESLINKKIDRKILGKLVFSDDKKLKILEKILHPRVRICYEKFLEAAQLKNVKLVVLNIPLLSESKAYSYDYLIAIIPSPEAQKQRFIAREKAKNPQASDAELIAKFDQIKAKQMSSEERKKIADFVIKNEGSEAEETIAVKKILDVIFN
jgi:dephospho-CoA kinase